jgi:RNase P/RNase MRP subunit p30
MVLLPKYSAASEVRVQAQLLLKQVTDRLALTGYAIAAVTHMVYGRPRMKEDNVESLLQLPYSVSTNSAANGTKGESTERPVKRSKVESNPPIRIVKRLHAVVENLADVGAYTRTSATESATTLSLLQEYDLVSLAPRNDATFQAACCASEVDIVTLDYTAGRGGLQLPFRIRPADVRAVVQRGAAFELHYAPALLHMNQRKALVQTARSFQMASVGVRPKPRFLFSSGDRHVVGDSDIGAMALRGPGDLINLLQTVLCLDATMAHDALGESATKILDRGRLRRLGQLDIRGLVDVYIDGEALEDKRLCEAPPLGAMERKRLEKLIESVKADEQQSDGDLEDGFITL